MQTLLVSSIIVNSTLSDNLINISASDGTNSIQFEALNHSSQIKEMLILAGQGLAASTPLEVQYETLNGLNLFMGVTVMLA